MKKNNCRICKVITFQKNDEFKLIKHLVVTIGMRIIYSHLRYKLLL